VCAGLAPVRGLGVGWVRLGFVLGALCGGIGIVFYLACWLIIPAEGDSGDATKASSIVLLARACAACIGLAALAGIGATATVFGFGWAIAGIAAAALVVVLAGWRRAGPGWALLPIAALAPPAVAVATSGVRLAPAAGRTVVAPRSTGELRAAVYRSGLDTMLIDLRRTAFPAAGTVPLRIQAGVRRTIVALPDDRCVHVTVRYDIDPFAARLGALLTGRSSPEFSDLVLFGHLFGSRGVAVSDSGVPGPVLAIEFSSQGGSLYVRDYPADVNPDVRPDWPGYPVTPEPRPDTNGLRRRAARSLIRSWRTRLAVELSSARRIDVLMPGPCRPASAISPTAARGQKR